MTNIFLYCDNLLFLVPQIYQVPSSVFITLEQKSLYLFEINVNIFIFLLKFSFEDKNSHQSNKFIIMQAKFI